MASSKSARRRRRQAAALRRYKRLRRADRLPVHTRPERRRAAAERERLRETERRKVGRIRATAAGAAPPTAALAVMVLAPPAHISPHELYEPYFAAQPTSWPDRPDYPHTELLEAQEPHAFIPAAGTAAVSSGSGLYPSGGVNRELHPVGPLTRSLARRRHCRNAAVSCG